MGKHNTDSSFEIEVLTRIIINYLMVMIYSGIGYIVLTHFSFINQYVNVVNFSFYNIFFIGSTLYLLFLNPSEFISPFLKNDLDNLDDLKNDIKNKIKISTNWTMIVLISTLTSIFIYTPFRGYLFQLFLRKIIGLQFQMNVSYWHLLLLGLVLNWITIGREHIEFKDILDRWNKNKITNE